MSSVYLVVGCNEYEPDDIIYIASTKEKALTYMDKTFNFLARVEYKDPLIYTTYDYVDIKDRPVDE